MKADNVQLPVATANTSATRGANAPAGAKVALDPVTSKTVELLTQAASAPATQEMNMAVRAAAAQIDSYLKSVGREVEFRVDEDTGVTIVTVRETATGDVIRQIPNDEVLQLARSLKSGSSALLDLKI
jgi:flagellar protein FlaG